MKTTEEVRVKTKSESAVGYILTLFSSFFLFICFFLSSGLPKSKESVYTRTQAAARKNVDNYLTIIRIIGIVAFILFVVSLILTIGKNPAPKTMVILDILLLISAIIILILAILVLSKLDKVQLDASDEKSIKTKQGFVILFAFITIVLSLISLFVLRGETKKKY